jgi:hypothetical protein
VWQTNGSAIDLSLPGNFARLPIAYSALRSHRCRRLNERYVRHYPGVYSNAGVELQQSCVRVNYNSPGDVAMAQESRTSEIRQGRGVFHENGVTWMIDQLHGETDLIGGVANVLLHGHCMVSADDDDLY